MKVIIFLLCTLLSSCATLFKTDKGEVPVAVGPETEIFLKSGNPLKIYERRDGSQFVKVNPMRHDTLVFKRDSSTRAILPDRYVEFQWIWVNVFTYGAGHAIDWYSGNWYSFEEIRTSFSTEDNNIIQRRKLQQARYWDTLRGIFSDDPKVFLYASWGVASPTYQVPVLGNVLSGGIGYRATSWLDMCIERELAGSVALKSYDQGGLIIRTGLSTRLHPLQFIDLHGLYIHGGIGQFHVNLWEGGRHISSQRIDPLPPMQQNMAGVTYGLGYGGEYFRAEWKAGKGLETIYHPIDGEFTPSYSAFTIGLHLYL